MMTSPIAKVASSTPFYYLAIDVEASGSNYSSSFVPCIGAALIEVQTERVVDRFFSFVAQPAGTEWDERCVREFWSKPENYEWYQEILRALSDPTKARPAKEVMYEFVAWARAHAKRVGVDNIVVVSDTAGFDVGFLDHIMPPPYSMLYLFDQYKPTRDISSFHMGVARCTPQRGLWGSFTKAYQVLTPSGTAKPKFEFENDHRPDHDAAHIGLTAARISNLIDSCSASIAAE